MVRRTRFIFVVLALGLIWLSLVLRALMIQILPNKKLSDLRTRQFETIVKLEPRRGDILDRQGIELASSISSYSLFADPKMIRRPYFVAQKLAKILNQPARKILSKLTESEKHFVWIERRLDRDAKDDIENFKMSGLGFVEEGRRIYPRQELAAQTLGFVGQEGQGLEGLERVFDLPLHGNERKISMRRDALGRPLISNGHVFSEQPEGVPIQLTLDANLQYELESELQDVTHSFDAERALGIVLDAQTSEVLAMGSYPTFNANRPNQSAAEWRRNPVVTDAYEPGSTLKTFTVAAALRAKKVQPNTQFYCEKGKMKIGKYWVKEAEAKEKWEWLTVSQILERSSNIGATKIAFELGEQELRKALADFGFGEKTGIEAPGETRGLMPPLPWPTIQFSTVSFGHGISVSPLQIATAYASIANGGIWRAPHVVRSNDVPAERRVLNEADAATLRLMLTGVSTLGSGKLARIPGFIVAGKTGTAQKVDTKRGGYMKNTYISSFAGFVPANRPKFVIYVAVDAPKKAYYGSEVAAPVFNRIAEYALRAWNISPTVLSDQNLLSVKPQAQEPSVEQGAWKRVPALSGLTLREVLDYLEGQQIDVKIRGRGYVSRTIPSAGQSLTPSGKLTVILSQ